MLRKGKSENTPVSQQASIASRFVRISLRQGAQSERWDSKNNGMTFESGKKAVLSCFRNDYRDRIS